MGLIAKDPNFALFLPIFGGLATVISMTVTGVLISSTQAAMARDDMQAYEKLKQRLKWLTWLPVVFSLLVFMLLAPSIVKAVELILFCIAVGALFLRVQKSRQLRSMQQIEQLAREGRLEGLTAGELSKLFPQCSWGFLATSLFLFAVVTVVVPLILEP